MKKKKSRGNSWPWRTQIMVRLGNEDHTWTVPTDFIRKLTLLEQMAE